jgi:glycosyltransferase involved in cell wall biosynthesis
MIRLVTVAVPVYNDLQYLPATIRSVAAQDYPNIEFLVSDNGLNGTKVPEIVAQNCSRGYRFRQNPATVPMHEHFNQLVQEATGEYFVLLCDDDQISANFVTELVAVLERHPEASLAISSQETIDESGSITSKTVGPLPEIMSGEDCIRAWCSGQYAFNCPVTLLVKTTDLKDSGGYQGFIRGLFSDFGILVRLCLGRQVAFGSNCTFRWRHHKSSLGHASNHLEVAEACKQFLKYLDSEPKITAFAQAHPREWGRLRPHLVRFTWNVYFWSWLLLKDRGASVLNLTKAAFAMPLIPAYYLRIFRSLLVVVIKPRHSLSH